MDSFPLKCHNSFQNVKINEEKKEKKKEKPNTLLLPNLWFLRCNKKVESSIISVCFGAPQKLI